MFSVNKVFGSNEAATPDKVSKTTKKIRSNQGLKTVVDHAFLVPFITLTPAEEQKEYTKSKCVYCKHQMGGLARAQVAKMQCCNWYAYSCYDCFYNAEDNVSLQIILVAMFDSALTSKV